MNSGGPRNEIWSRSSDDRASRRLRLKHVSDAISDIESLIGGRSIEQLKIDRFGRAAFERFLEIISEASRHIPEEMKALHPTIGWREIAAMGNRLRHAFDQVELGILWDIYTKDLGPLAEAIRQLQERVSSATD